MKKHLSKFIYLVVLVLLQTGALVVFSDRTYIVPQLTLLFVLVAAFNLPYVQMLWLSFIAGSFLELVSGLFFGTYISGIVIIGIANFLITRKLTTREASPVGVVILVLASTLALTVWAFLYNGFLGFLDLASGSYGFSNFFSLKMIVTFLINLIFYYPVLWGFRFLPKTPEHQPRILSR